MNLIGYARVSTEDQSLALQRDALQTAGCAVVFEDTVPVPTLRGRASATLWRAAEQGTCWLRRSWTGWAGRWWISSA